MPHTILARRVGEQGDSLAISDKKPCGPGPSPRHIDGHRIRPLAGGGLEELVQATVVRSRSEFRRQRLALSNFV